jgi:UDP-N-acetylmuramoyl-L-alanyl-D-glutamate--2,6-diaminopimelate ligase
MNLSKIIDAKDPIKIFGSKEKEFLGIRTNSKEVRPKDLFISTTDNFFYVDEAMKAGAVAVVLPIHNPFIPKTITQIVHAQPYLYAGILANRFYQNPSQTLQLVGVTGTSGKSTTTWMIRHLLGEGTCGVIGTLGAFMQGHSLETPLTTPEPVTLCKLLQEMVRTKHRYCAMEVSSHGLDQDRVSHLSYDAAIFLNLTHDHLDYHGSMESYYLAKKKLFSLVSNLSIIHVDDPYGKRLSQEIQTQKILVGSTSEADYQIMNIDLSLHRSSCDLKYKEKIYRLEIPLVGSYHLVNMVCAIAFCHQKGIDLHALLDKAKEFNYVPGRSEMIYTQKGFSIMVDYAHKPDALEKLLISLKQAGAKKITTVFGCGGERDALKRPMMARIAEKYSDKVIVTTDNPRKEDPNQILEQICQGFVHNKHHVVPDRKEAIKFAIECAQIEELILIAGRGHEREQKLKTASIPFLDSQVAKNLLVEI